jgi:putative MATE family efflux protein
LFAAIGLFTIKPLFRLLGADSQILPYIVEYMRIWYIGVAFVVIPMIGNNAIRALGDTKTPSVVMAVAALANAILDPLLIFGYAFVKPMGISGAAIATVISRAITLVVALRILIGREKLIVFKGVKLKEMCASWRDILFIGLPDALTKMIVPIAAGILTGIVALFGKEAVASFGIGTRLEMFVLMVNGALASVMIPFIGQNLGAGELGRVKKGIRAGEFFVIFYGIGMAVIFIVFGRFFAEIFTASDIVADLVQQYLWIVPLSYFAQGIILISGTGFIVMRKPIITALLTAVRMFAICVPLAMLWAKSYGLVGVWASISVSFFIIALAAHVLMMHHLKQLSR